MLDNTKLELLKSLKKNNYDFSDLNKIDLTYSLIENIGDKDGFIRDGLVYPVLAHLLHDNVLEKEELIKIARLLISDQYLFYDINNEEEYSVLKRSFTLLQLAILVYKHNSDKSLSDEVVHDIALSFGKYFELESDLRGYDELVGWCHSIAHSADLFTQLFKSEVLSSESIAVMLELIRDKFIRKDYQFVSDEDERMVNALEVVILNEKVSNDILVKWIESFSIFEKGEEWPGIYIILANIKHILRSLYFRILDNDTHKDLVKVIKETLNKIK